MLCRCMLILFNGCDRYRMASNQTGGYSQQYPTSQQQQYPSNYTPQTGATSTMPPPSSQPCPPPTGPRPQMRWGSVRCFQYWWIDILFLVLWKILLRCSQYSICFNVHTRICLLTHFYWYDLYSSFIFTFYRLPFII